MARLDRKESGSDSAILERPQHRIAAELLLNYEWSDEELVDCMRGAKDFKQLVRNLRERLLGEGLIDQS